MPSHYTRQVNFIGSCRAFCAFVFLAVPVTLPLALPVALIAACHPPMKPLGKLREDSLPARIAEVMAATGTYRDAEAVLLAERARGEEGRARLLLAALLQRHDPVWQAEFLHDLADIVRPERVPYVE